jgi:hypothetical protein
VSEDTATLLSPQHIDEFCFPYTRRLLAEFGGGWVHFCGSNPHLYSGFRQLPEVSGLNFGNPERFDATEVIAGCQQRGIVYNGALSFADSPPPQEFYQRIWQALGGRKSGLILHGPSGPDPAAMVAWWHELQSKSLLQESAPAAGTITTRSSRLMTPNCF